MSPEGNRAHWLSMSPQARVALDGWARAHKLSTQGTQEVADQVLADLLETVSSFDELDTAVNRGTSEPVHGREFGLDHVPFNNHRDSSPTQG